MCRSRSVIISTCATACAATQGRFCGTRPIAIASLITASLAKTARGAFLSMSRRKTIHKRSGDMEPDP